MQGLMAGKRGLIMGVANQRSIAWGIAKACADAGAELAFTYQGEALERRVRPLAEGVNAEIMPCDVTDSASLDAVFEKLKSDVGAELQTGKGTNKRQQELRDEQHELRDVDEQTAVRGRAIIIRRRRHDHRKSPQQENW